MFRFPSLERAKQSDDALCNSGVRALRRQASRHVAAIESVANDVKNESATVGLALRLYAWACRVTAVPCPIDDGAQRCLAALVEGSHAGFQPGLSAWL